MPFYAVPPRPYATKNAGIPPAFFLKKDDVFKFTPIQALPAFTAKLNIFPVKCLAAFWTNRKVARTLGALNRRNFCYW